MTDREKVIKGLTYCTNPLKARCPECPYYPCYDEDTTSEKLLADALKLLKEQEPVKPVDVHMYSKMYANVKSGYCPIYSNPVDKEEGVNFCCRCGRRLKWDD